MISTMILSPIHFLKKIFYTITFRGKFKVTFYLKGGNHFSIRLDELDCTISGDTKTLKWSYPLISKKNIFSPCLNVNEIQAITIE